jgi:hypothetical protein
MRSRAPQPIEDPFGGANRSRANGSGGQAEGVKTLDRAKMIQDEVKSLRAAEKDATEKTPDDKLREKATATVDGMIGGGTPEDQLRSEIKAGKLTSPEAVKKRAAELGARLK